MRIFVSSTFEDLREHRAAAIRVLRQLGHEVLAMEDMVAASNTPLARVIQMVDRSDAYVGIFAWRYGYVPRPTGASIRPAKRPSTVPDVKDAVYGVVVPVSTTRASAVGELARQVVDVVDKSSLNHRLALTYLQELKERARIA